MPPDAARIAPYGSWKSPISADLIAAKTVSFADVLADPITSAIYHIESRPVEEGRNVIVDTKSGRDAFGREWNARTKVHEYGGAQAVAYKGAVYFSNLPDGRVYKLEKGGVPLAITPENRNHRFADFTVHPLYNNFVVSILEDHTHDTADGVLNSLIVIDAEGCTVHDFISGRDFYSSPTFSPDGTKIAWIQWQHPNMPWDGAELFVADVTLTDGSLRLGQARHLAGEGGKCSAMQPKWASGEKLLFTCDLAGYKNPWIARFAKSLTDVEVGPILAEVVQEDFGRTLAIIGVPPLAPLSPSLTICHAIKHGRYVLYVMDIEAKTLTPLPNPYVHIASILAVSSTQAVFVGSTTHEPDAVVSCSLQIDGGTFKPTFQVLCASGSPEGTRLLKEFVSPFNALTLSVPPHNEPLHVNFYPPQNPAYAGPDHEKPPCILYIHGGPTRMQPLGLDIRRIYFTSRGFAWVDVNYGGSSGYGRAYIERLKGKWGIVDVCDSVETAKQLSSEPYSFIDPKRVVITGPSAGGFTTLCALCTASDTFAAGASSYGVSDLRRLLLSTHKYEARYLDQLMGGTLQEVPEVYKERSAIFNADKIRSPLLILQGTADFVVPPEQAQMITDKIRANNGWCESLFLEGEGHGFRKAENIIKALQTELDFFRRVLEIQSQRQ